MFSLPCLTNLRILLGRIVRLVTAVKIGMGFCNIVAIVSAEVMASSMTPDAKKGSPPKN